MSAYLLSVIDKRDHATYAEYVAAGFASLRGIEFEAIVGERPEVLEGTLPGTAVVLMRFNSLDEARNWYNSEAYQKAIPLRHAAARTPFVVLFPGNDEPK
jgi:uncharacterized protein (DUF1330 family)